MGMKCNNCGKGVMYGHNVSHSKRRTRKIFKPNLHVARITVGSQSMKVRLCTKCLRMFKRATLRSNSGQTAESTASQVATA
ncbi:MAG TPA: 50S ribosomal protein L28 [Methylomirabilota bacterium]|nr:50S ribosomal protein L28 [Methylomirabilota bacterium]